MDDSLLRSQSEPNTGRRVEKGGKKVALNNNKAFRAFDHLKDSPYRGLLASVESSLGHFPQKKNTPSYETSNAMKMQATAVLNRTKTNIVPILQSQTIRGNKLKTKARLNESQGPIDWTLNSLRLKYRGESERERCWRQSQISAEKSQLLFETSSQVCPSVAVDRHPVVLKHAQLLKQANEDARSSIASRLLMKRFLCDVQEVWLSNILHFPEHRPSNSISSSSSPSSSSPVAAIAKTSSSSAPVRRSLRGRRDVAAISNMHSQIQSVSYKRAMKRAFITSPMEPPTVFLSDALLTAPRPLPPLSPPPVIELLCSPFSSPDTGLLLHRTLLYSLERLIPSEKEQNSLRIIWRLVEFDRRSSIVVYYYCCEDDVMNAFNAEDLDRKETAQRIALAIINTCESTAVPLYFTSSNLNFIHSWESYLSSPLPSLSLVASGGHLRLSQVPGACEFGKPGLWPDMIGVSDASQSKDKDRLLSFQHERQALTRVALTFSRNSEASSSDSIFVLATVAIDLFNFVTRTYLAWEPEGCFPPTAPSEDVEFLGLLPRIRAKPVSLLATPLRSLVHDRHSELICIHSIHLQRRMIRPEGSESDVLVLSAGKGKLIRRKKLIESSKEEHAVTGFRMRVFAELIDIDTQLGTQIFGDYSSSLLWLLRFL